VTEEAGRYDEALVHAQIMPAEALHCRPKRGC
jgi:hypothetical protein